LATKVPAFESHMPSLHPLHIEPDGWNRAVIVLVSCCLLESSAIDSTVSSTARINARRKGFWFARGPAYSIVNSPPWKYWISGGKLLASLAWLKAYRKHAKQRRLASVLEPYHCHVHLGRPLHVVSPGWERGCRTGNVVTNLPEGPEQPVVHFPEKPCHVVYGPSSKGSSCVERSVCVARETFAETMLGEIRWSERR
jgi:hypothetical protein